MKKLKFNFVNKIISFDWRSYIKLHTIPIKLLEFFKWKLIDLYRKIKYKPIPHLFGIRCIVGMYGMGKTMAMSWLALQYRLKYKGDIYICSNYGLLIQDFAFTSTDQLIQQYDKPVIFFWDEVQNDFPASDKNFPSEVRKALTLNRKGKGKLFFWASQDHELVHKTIRRLTIEYGEVKTIFSRYTRIKWYRKLDYELLTSKLDDDKRIKIHPVRKESFIQSDFIRDLYNSFSWDNGEKIRI